MKPYLITGPESLLKAAYEEIRKSDVSKVIASSHEQPFECLYLYAHGYWLAACVINGNEAKLTLPVDWNKLMGILAELKKPKLPEYVRGLRAKYKVIGIRPHHAHLYQGYNVMGKSVDLLINDCTPITEQEFIDGGLKELAEAGYVKGANFQWGLIPFEISSVSFQKNGTTSESVTEEIAAKGFCFTISGGKFTLPVSKCTLIPALPTTSAGIPYMLKDGNAVVYGKSGDLISLQCSTIRHLLRQGVTGLVTMAGHLVLTDLELLTK